MAHSIPRDQSFFGCVDVADLTYVSQLENGHKSPTGRHAVSYLYGPGDGYLRTQRPCRVFAPVAQELVALHFAAGYVSRT